MHVSHNFILTRLGDSGYSLSVIHMQPEDQSSENGYWKGKDRHWTKHRTGKPRVIKPFSVSPAISKYKPAL